MATISTDYLCENGFLVKRKRKKKRENAKEERQFDLRRGEKGMTHLASSEATTSVVRRWWLCA